MKYRVKEAKYLGESKARFYAQYKKEVIGPDEEDGWTYIKEEGTRFYNNITDALRCCKKHYYKGIEPKITIHRYNPINK